MKISTPLRQSVMAIALMGVGYGLATFAASAAAPVPASVQAEAPKLPIVETTTAPAALATAPTTTSHDRPDSFADLAQALLPAVVNISTIQTIKGDEGDGAEGMPPMPQFPPGSPFEEFFKQFEEQQKQQRGAHRAAALGSGFVIDAANGYVVTNNHVVEDADEIKVILQDDTNLEAKLIGRDPKTDLAILKVNLAGHKLTAVPWGDSDATRVGDWIVAIGNPFGLGGTVTQGIISARARDINSGPYDDFLQTDASINRGNSGGPMFNLKGEVVGINSAIYSPTGGSIGIGFAIPSNLAKGVITQLIEHGRTTRGWLGVKIQAVTPEIAESLNFGAPRGALVANVSSDGPAAKAGLQAGDIVTEFNGRPIEEMRRLPRIVAETPVGTEARIKVWRKGGEKTFTVKVAELEQDDATTKTTAVERGLDNTPSSSQVKVLGMSVGTLTEAIRAELGLDADTTGVVINRIKGDSMAAEVGLQQGDVIVEANQKEIKAPAELLAEIAAVKKEGRKSVFLLIARKDDLRYIALPLEERKPSDEKPAE